MQKLKMNALIGLDNKEEKRAIEYGSTSKDVGFVSLTKTKNVMRIFLILFVVIFSLPLLSETTPTYYFGDITITEDLRGDLILWDSSEDLEFIQKTTRFQRSQNEMISSLVEQAGIKLQTFTFWTDVKYDELLRPAAEGDCKDDYYIYHFRYDKTTLKGELFLVETVTHDHVRRDWEPTRNAQRRRTGVLWTRGHFYDSNISDVVFWSYRKYDFFNK